jgi:hypothetical protein
MDLLDRYLQAVRFWLPAKQKHDIIAELSEDLHTEIQEKEDTLGRPLNEDEQVELLKRFGPPMDVAGRYLPQQQPMPPAMFMLYRFVLKLVVLWVLLPLFIIVSAAPFFAAQNHAVALVETALRYLQASVFAVGMITIVFALLAKYQPQLGLDKWDPRALPKVRAPRDPVHIPRFGSANEVIWNVLFALWWVDFFRIPIGYGQQADAVRVTMVPVWHSFFWPILAVIVASVCLAAANFARPWWTRARASVRLAIDAAALVISLLLLRTGYYAEVSGSGLPATKAAEATHAMNLGLQIMFAVMAVAFALGVVADLRRLLRKQPAQLAHQTV